MKYSPDQYARAFIEVFKEVPKDERLGVLKRFIKLVAKNGDLARSSKIIEAVENILIKKNGGRLIEIDVARSVRIAMQKLFSSKDKVVLHINSELIAGMRITIDGERELDNTLKRKLEKILPA